MILNEEGKNEIRAQIIEKLKKVPDGKKVHLDKELLESLLFKTITYNRNTNEKLKVPVCGGEFLRKIDLSEVSFEDVAWSLVVSESYDHPEDSYQEFMDEESWKKMDDLLPKFNDSNESLITDYSWTNAKIDFKKSFEFKKTGKFHLNFCNFEGVDLSDNDMSYLENAFECNLSNTGIILKPEMFTGNADVFYCDNLTNVDLSNFKISVEDYMTQESPFTDCILTNTGLKLTLDPSDELWNSETQKYELRKNVIPQLCGCFINGVKVKSPDESLKSSEEKRKEYEKMKSDIISAVTNNIDEQIDRIKK